MLVGFASYFVFTFEVALVHLPVFTESCIWDAFFYNKVFLFVFIVINRKENDRTNF